MARLAGQNSSVGAIVIGSKYQLYLEASDVRTSREGTALGDEHHLRATPVVASLGGASTSRGWDCPPPTGSHSPGERDPYRAL